MTTMIDSDGATSSEPATGLMVTDARIVFPGEGRAAPVVAVDGVSLALGRGERLALLGPSGSGKSTLLRAVAGLDRLTSGVVRWDGQDLATVPAHRRGFALMLQDGQLFEHRDVAGNVGYALEVAGVGRRDRAERVALLLDSVELQGFEARAISTLSGGQRQRVALARALAAEPRLLLLDEPLSSLDVGLRSRLAALLREATEARALGAVLVTHDPEEAFAFADRIGLMQEGRLVALLTAAEFAAADESTAAGRFLRGIVE